MLWTVIVVVFGSRLVDADEGRQGQDEVPAGQRGVRASGAPIGGSVGRDERYAGVGCPHLVGGDTRVVAVAILCHVVHCEH